MNSDQYSESFRMFGERNDGRFPIVEANRWPILKEDQPQKADYSFEYLAHCGWAARILMRTQPERHADFGSHVYFAGIASAICPFDFYDIRPIDMPLPGLNCQSADLTVLSLPSNYYLSVSCMHVIEHIGLGRYGDKIDPLGDIKAARELMRITQSGGQLIIVEPINQTPRLSFNAHRLYSYQQVLDLFPSMKLEEFTLIKDRSIIPNASPSHIVDQDIETNDTGCFLFRKP